MAIGSHARTLVAFLVAFLAAVLPVSAAFLAQFSPDVAVIELGGQTTFALEITHDSPNAETFEVYSTDVLWDLHTADALIVEPGERFTTDLFLRPLHFNPGVYRVPISVRLARTTNVQSKVLEIELRSKDQPIRGYIPAVRGFFEMPKSVDARQAIPIDVSLQNQNLRNLTNVVLKFRSALINKDFTVDLGPLDKKSLHYDIPLDPLAAPQADVLRLAVLASADGVTYQFDFKALEYAVAPYGGVTEDVADTKYFLGRTRVITLANTGNAQYGKTVALPLNLLARLFTKTSVQGEYARGAYTWDVSLNPSESRTITVRTNYWPPFIVLVIAGLILLAYYLFRSPLVVVKRAMVVAAKEGGISELKVILSLRNRSPAPLKKIHLIDVVPNIAEVSRETELGSIAPNKVLQHEKKGTLVKWSLEHVDAHEERIITYRIKSKLGILGGVRLPIAVARFESGAGGERSVRSNAPSLVVGSKVCV